MRAPGVRFPIQKPVIMASKDRNYTNGEITVHWKPDKCIHAAECVTKLPEVFDVKKRPWVTIEGATTERIIHTVELCPSGALTYSKN